MGYDLSTYAAITAPQPPRPPVAGPLLVTVVAAKFNDRPQEPFNYSYIYAVVFGPFPSVRDFWEYESGGAIKLRPCYVHWGWLTLPRSRDTYCTSAGIDFAAIAQDVINLLYGVQLPNRSYLIVALNDRPSCLSEAAGQGTIGFWLFNTPYGSRWLAVSLIYYYNQTLDVDVYAHEFGHNLGLGHSGTANDEYDNLWDVMGDWRAWAWGNWWWGLDWYYAGLSLYHKYYLGWANLSRSPPVGEFAVSSNSGVYIDLGGGSLLVPSYHRGVRYEPYWKGFFDYAGQYGLVNGANLPTCAVVLYDVLSNAVGRWVYLVSAYNSTALDGFLTRASAHG